MLFWGLGYPNSNTERIIVRHVGVWGLCVCLGMSGECMVGYQVEYMWVSEWVWGVCGVYGVHVEYMWVYVGLGHVWGVYMGMCV